MRDPGPGTVLARAAAGAVDRGTARRPAGAWFILALYLAHGAFWLCCQRLNEDEGWYLEAGRRVLAGHLPYRDFAFTQTPLAPYLYGLPLHFLGGGLWTGRATALLLGCGTLALVLATAERLAGRRAALAAGLLLASNAYAVAYLTLVKMYAPAALLLMAAVWAYVAAPPTRWRPFATLAFAAGATLTRLSLLPLLAVLGVALLLEAAGWRRRGAVLAALALAVGVLLIPAFPDPAAFRFNVLEYPLVNQGRYHLVRADLAGGPTPLAALWAFAAVKVPLLGAIGVRQGAALPLLAAGGVAQLRRRRGGRVAVLGVALASGILVQLAGAPYAEYAVPFMPLAALLAGVVLARASRAISAAVVAPWRAHLAIATIVAGLATVDTGQLVPSVPSPPRQLDRAAALIRAAVPPGMPILTFETYLAVQADRPLPTELALSHYSYYRSLPEVEAARFHVINDDDLRQILRGPPLAAVAVTDTTFTIFAPPAAGEPAIRALIEAHYRLVATIPDFGQWGDTLYLYLPREPE